MRHRIDAINDCTCRKVRGPTTRKSRLAKASRDFFLGGPHRFTEARPELSCGYGGQARTVSKTAFGYFAATQRSTRAAPRSLGYDTPENLGSAQQRRLWEEETSYCSTKSLIGSVERQCVRWTSCYQLDSKAIGRKRRVCPSSTLSANLERESVVARNELITSRTEQPVFYAVA